MSVDIKLMEDWREKQEVCTIDIGGVVITEPIHLNANKIKFSKNIDRVSVYSCGRDIPIIVREIDGGVYELLFGLRQLTIARFIGKEDIKAIKVDYGRREFLDVLKEQYDEYWKIDDIKIHERFRKSRPHASKVISKGLEIEKGSIQPIIVDCDSKYLIDGYITYLILKFKGVRRVKVRLEKK